MGAFLDIEEAFDRTSIEAISLALLRHGVPPLFERWIPSMLSSRYITSSLKGETMLVAAVRKVADRYYYHHQRQIPKHSL